MKMNINGGSLEITDNNETIVSDNIAKHINDNFKKPDDDKQTPLFTIKE